MIDREKFVDSMDTVGRMTTLVKDIPSSSANRMQLQCALIYTTVCPYPKDCSGFDNRKCDCWQRCSSR